MIYLNVGLSNPDINQASSIRGLSSPILAKLCIKKSTSFSLCLLSFMKNHHHTPKHQSKNQYTKYLNKQFDIFCFIIKGSRKPALYKILYPHLITKIRVISRTVHSEPCGPQYCHLQKKQYI